MSTPAAPPAKPGFLRGLIIDPIARAIRAEIKEQMETYLPLITEVIVRTMTEMTIKYGGDAVDKVTDMIPGEVDDALIDERARQIITRLGDLFGQFTRR